MTNFPSTSTRVNSNIPSHSNYTSLPIKRCDCNWCPFAGALQPQTSFPMSFWEIFLISGYHSRGWNLWIEQISFSVERLSGRILALLFYFLIYWNGQSVERKISEILLPKTKCKKETRFKMYNQNKTRDHISKQLQMHTYMYVCVCTYISLQVSHILERREGYVRETCVLVVLSLTLAGFFSSRNLVVSFFCFLCLTCNVWDGWWGVLVMSFMWLCG